MINDGDKLKYCLLMSSQSARLYLMNTYTTKTMQQKCYAVAIYLS